MIDELRAQVARLSRRDSMQMTLTCPACGCGQILAVRQVKENTGDGSAPLSLGSYLYWVSGMEGDPLYVYVCTSCRLVEWHAFSTDHIRPDDDQVKLLVRPATDVPGVGPYR